MWASLPGGVAFFRIWLDCSSISLSYAQLLIGISSRLWVSRRSLACLSYVSCRWQAEQWQHVKHKLLEPSSSLVHCQLHHHALEGMTAGSTKAESISALRFQAQAMPPTEVFCGRQYSLQRCQCMLLHWHLIMATCAGCCGSLWDRPFRECALWQYCSSNCTTRTHGGAMQDDLEMLRRKFRIQTAPSAWKRS